jgi:uncharacterized delta-60 repeat protein
VTTAIGSETEDDGAAALALQPDGKLVAAGHGHIGSHYAFALARYNPNGSLDTSFNGTGKVTTAIGSLGSYPSALALQPDGKLVEAGESSNGYSRERFALARYNPDGSLDTSFNGTGKVTTAIGLRAHADALLLQPDGKLVAAGYSRHGSSYDFALARYNPDGSLDTSFNSNGKLTTPIGPGTDSASALVLQPNGRLVAAGSSDNGSRHMDFALARYRRDVLCVVPQVKGKTLQAAERAIRRAQCSVGRVTRPFSATVKKGRVISQKPGPGKKLAAGFKVKLTVSNGKKA